MPLDIIVFGAILNICANEVLLDQNKEVLALTYVYLNILAVHLNVYITDIHRNLFGVLKLRLLGWE